MGFFQQCLQLILQTYFVTRPLILCARECPPETLFGIGHKAQGQLLRQAALPNVPHRESLSCARADHDWTRLAPDAGFPTSGLHLRAPDTSASSIVPALPIPVANIATSIPSPLPRLAAPPTTPKAVATPPGCFRTSVARIGIPRRLPRQPQPPPASSYGHQFRLSYMT